MEALWRDVLKESPNEFLGFHGQAFWAPVVFLLVVEGDGVLVNSLNPVVVDGHSVYVSGQVTKNGLGPMSGVFDV